MEAGSVNNTIAADEISGRTWIFRSFEMTFVSAAPVILEVTVFWNTKESSSLRNICVSTIPCTLKLRAPKRVNFTTTAETTTPATVFVTSASGPFSESVLGRLVVKPVRDDPSSSSVTQFRLGLPL